ncbi:MAG: hypothetical protein IPN96_04585 [Anaerolineales bacterium]|nr:hypothetical protein [Anaerolineales bacterium]
MSSAFGSDHLRFLAFLLHELRRLSPSAEKDCRPKKDLGKLAALGCHRLNRICPLTRTYPIGFDSGNNYPLHLGPWMLGGFVPLFLGLGLISSPIT